MNDQLWHPCDSSQAQILKAESQSHFPAHPEEPCCSKNLRPKLLSDQVSQRVWSDRSSSTPAFESQEFSVLDAFPLPLEPQRTGTHKHEDLASLQKAQHAGGHPSIAPALNYKNQTGYQVSAPASQVLQLQVCAITHDRNTHLSVGRLWVGTCLVAAACSSGLKSLC